VLEGEASVRDPPWAFLSRLVGVLILVSGPRTTMVPDEGDKDVKSDPGKTDSEDEGHGFQSLKRSIYARACRSAAHVRQEQDSGVEQGVPHLSAIRVASSRFECG
jgi:hypothetical protein